jgi:2-oxo-3-(phosphooxy)propyl 3-oxoalkanoate synthase
MTATVESPATDATLRFAATVPCAYVHKRAIEEVLLTDAATTGGHDFLCAAQLPRSHRTYVPNGGRHHDLLLLLEVVRQATILTGHRHLDVPADRQFLLREVELAVEDLDACRHGDGPAHAVIGLITENVRRLDGVVASFDLRGCVTIDGRHAASGEGSCLCLADEDYRALRGAPRKATSMGLPSPGAAGRAHPAEVGRAEAREVMVSAIERPAPDVAQAEAIVDPAHPTFFDHPLDHVPATLLLEAARQTARATLPAEVETVALACRARFLAFAELQRPVGCRARRRSSPSAFKPQSAEVEVAIEQDGSLLAQLAFEMGPPDA